MYSYLIYILVLYDQEVPQDYLYPYIFILSKLNYYKMVTNFPEIPKVS